MDNKKLNELLKGIFESLTEEQKKKAAACKTFEELTAFLTNEGVELPDELLDAVSGGQGFPEGWVPSGWLSGFRNGMDDSGDKRIP